MPLSASVCFGLVAEVRDVEDCAQVLRCIASSSSCPAQYGLTLLSVVRHLARVCLHGARNQLSPRTLADSFSPVLFRHSTGSVTPHFNQASGGTNPPCTQPYTCVVDYCPVCLPQKKS